MRRRWKWFALALALVVAFATWFETRDVCVRTWLSTGVKVPVCASGELRPVARVDAFSLRRGRPSVVQVSAWAAYTTGPADLVLYAPIPKFDATLALVDATGRATSLEPMKKWRASTDGVRDATVLMPSVADGRYALRATIHTRLGDATIDAPVALFAPAKVHVLTDRPLYRPGDTMRFRAVVLRARDLVPLEKRPGTWSVVDPNGDTVLEENVPSGDWGVTSGSFPIDAGAPAGSWHVRYASGDATDDVVVEVHPFVLPRFRVEVSAAKSFYGVGDVPVLAGRVVYSSGAPVAKASVDVAWRVEGEWPPPTDWTESLLPKHATTDASGSFSLTLPRVPTDLRGRATLVADLAAIDEAGDRIGTTARILLSEDNIQATAVTELPGGLVDGFDNRVFIRVTDAAGNVLASKHVRVRRAWDAGDHGLEAQTDADGVAAFQLDPGPAVNVVVPPMPVRLPKVEPGVTRTSLDEELSNADVSLADQRALDAWPKLLEPCARFAVESSRDLELTLEVDRSGRVTDLVTTGDALGRCARASLEGRSLSAGPLRLYAMGFHFLPPPLATFSDEASDGSEPQSLSAALADAMADARRCVPDDLEGALPVQLVVRTHEGTKRFETRWLPYDGPAKLTPVAVSCFESAFARLVPSADASTDELTALRFSATPSPRARIEHPQATTMLGYELVVSARDGDRELGTTKLRLGPGTIPPLRLRASPVLASAGGVVTVEQLRGPDFTGVLAKKLFLTSASGRSLESDVDAKSREARFTLPTEAEGWYSVEYDGEVARVYVRPRAELAVSVTPDAPRLAPGDTAKLAVRTTLGGVGHPAAVGLFGVDESLAQLATLPGVDDFARVRPRMEMATPAFDGLDAQALSMGRVTGENAAAAIVLRAGAPPSPAELDTNVAVTGAQAFDATSVVVDHFYAVLGDLYGLERAWETSAPKGEVMHPATMAALWSRALDLAATSGEATDAYGRRLELSRLPRDLSALVDPRAVVVDGKRLPEDVESWSDFVAKERP